MAILINENTKLITQGIQHKGMAIIEVLDAEAEARYAHLADLRQFVLRQRARFALERDFFGLLPGNDRLQ